MTAHRVGPEPDVHGGNVYAAARGRRGSTPRLVDFSASINPLGPSPLVLRAAETALRRGIAHYPDPDCAALLGTLAKRLRVNPNNLLLGNGSAELLYVLARALPIRRALILGPTFTEYERAVLAAGGRADYLHAARAEEYAPPLAEAAAALAGSRIRFDVVFLCNPNSPTGRVVGRTAVLELVRAAAKRGIWAVVDEAFIDYAEEASVLREVRQQGHLLVLRSFTKFYAVPGLRLGCLVGPQGLIATLKAQQPPWTVNVVAQAAGVAALRDRGHERASLAYMERARRQLANALRAIGGVTVFPSAANFLLLELPDRRGAAWYARHLLARGLMVRDCSRIAGLNNRTIRVAVRRLDENRRLVAALSELIG